MGRPIAIKSMIAFAMPDVCYVTVPVVGKVPLPFPNVAQLSGADKVSDTAGKELKVGGQHVLLKGAKVQSSSGNEASQGGVKSNATTGECEIVQGSATVKYGGESVVRFGDSTKQNTGNTIGMVLSANPTVLVGG